MNFTERIRQVYADQNIVIREKAVSLALLNGILSVGFLALGAIRIAGGHLAMGLGEAALALFLFSSVFAIFKHHFQSISYVSMGFFVVAAVALFFLRDIESGRDIYVQSTYIIPVLIAAPLLSYKMVQITAALASSLLAICLQFYLRIIPAVEALGGSVDTSDMVVAFIMTFFCGLFAYQIFRAERTSLTRIQENLDASNDQFARLHGLIGRSAETFNVGARLETQAQENAQFAVSITEETKSMAGRLNDLLENVSDTSDSSQSRSVKQ